MALFLAIFEIAKNGIWPKKNFREIDLFYFMSFFGWTFLNFLAHYEFAKLQGDELYIKARMLCLILNSSQANIFGIWAWHLAKPDELTHCTTTTLLLCSGPNGCFLLKTCEKVAITQDKTTIFFTSKQTIYYTNPTT